MHDRVQNITAMQIGRVLAAVQWTSATATATATATQRPRQGQQQHDVHRYEPRRVRNADAGKYARTRHGTYSMGVFDTWRASEATNINLTFRTTRMTIPYTHTVIDNTDTSMCSHIMACRNTYPQFFFFHSHIHEGCWRKDQGFLTLVTWRLRMWTRKELPVVRRGACRVQTCV